MSKGTVVVLAIAVMIAVGVVSLVASWSSTPFGKLDSRVALLLKYSDMAKVDLFKEGRSIPEVREFSRKGTAFLRGKGVPLPEVRDMSIPARGGEVPVRVYFPEGKAPFPVVVYYHGGGWVMGDLDSHDGLCRYLAAKTPAVVMSVGYRLAPEYPFPTAVEDAWAAVRWAVNNAATIKGDPKRIAVAGDSAGGNLAAVVARLARSTGVRLSAQVLIYPATNLARLDTESYKNFGEGYHLTRRYVEKFRELYMPDPKDWSDEKASPLLGKDPEGLAPAFVLTAQFDVLRDEGEAYASMMKEAGVEVTVKRYPGVIHGFIVMDRII
ncbi:MAG TPA: alpha/beta hydrolase, partial [Spirochaetes bacterium]|nr:alpha/beta hydrolase [Spirochaetota bacterium]